MFQALPPPPPAIEAPAPERAAATLTDLRVAAALTDAQVRVDSSFSGASIVLYGAVFNPTPDPADVVVVVFTDYRCPVCRRTDGALERLLASDPHVRVHFKDWPILGEASRLGAQAALAAERQGKYLALHRALMEDPAPLSAERLPELARKAGLDADRLARDMAEHGRDIDEQLNRHAAQAFALGLRGTPAYLVGPYLIEGGLDERKLDRAVAKARRAGPPR